MAERWQQWMPFHIDRFRGSQEVQAMHPAARSGFLYLLASAWQTDDCTISSDPVDLATESGLGDELWATYGARILRKFLPIGDRFQNAVQLVEWDDARRVFEARQANAKRTHSKRSSHDEHEHSKSTAPCNADTQTLTGTVTSTGTNKKQKTSRSEVASDPRHVVFRNEIERYATQKSVLFVWDQTEASQLALLLKAAPMLDLAGFQKCLLNRARSPGTPHGDRPRVWLPHILKYQEAPLNEFGKTGGGNGNFKGKSGHSVDAATRAIQAIEDRHAADGDGHSETGEAGHRGLPAIRERPGEVRTDGPGSGGEGYLLEATR